jgi:hypothetical protein
MDSVTAVMVSVTVFLDHHSSSMDLDDRSSLMDLDDRSSLMDFVDSNKAKPNLGTKLGSL